MEALRADLRRSRQQASDLARALADANAAKEEVQVQPVTGKRKKALDDVEEEGQRQQQQQEELPDGKRLRGRSPNLQDQEQEAG